MRNSLKVAEDNSHGLVLESRLLFLLLKKCSKMPSCQNSLLLMNQSASQKLPNKLVTLKKAVLGAVVKM
jgi:hypothetical protein